MREAVILAGGAGTRLGDATRTMPKPLLEVGGAPLIDTLIWNLARHGIERIVLSLGANAGPFVDHLERTHPRGAELVWRVEEEPLGTGGALAFVAPEIRDDEFLLLNGDTIFDLNYLDLALLRRVRGATAALALRNVDEAAGFGTVHVEGERVLDFAEKNSAGPARVSAGVYACSRELLGALPTGASSLEREVLPGLAAAGELDGRTYDGYFVDIGTPAALEAAQRSLPAWRAKPAIVLDRDGVVNVDHGYVHSPDDWEWIPGAPEAVKWLNDHGFLVFVVTNQAGIARGLFSEEEYYAFERWVAEQLADRGAHVEATYHCPHHPDFGPGGGTACDCRKPAPGMLLAAISEWGLDEGRTVLVGDKPTDVAAANAAGIDGVLFPEGADLLAFVQALVAEKRLEPLCG